MKALHRAYAENQPLLFSISYPENTEGGIIMRMRHDDRLILTRRPEDADGKSEYELKWSSGSTILEEVVNLADSGLPQFSLVENLSRRQLHQMGWSDISFNFGTSKISGQYRYEYGVHGMLFDDNEDSKYKVTIAKAAEGYPGASAGLEYGDAIVAVDGVPVGSDASDNVETKLIRLPGSRVALRIYRSNSVPTDIKLAKAAHGAFGVLGLSATKSGPQSDGASVTFVQDGGPAAQAGIHVSDVIKEIDKVPLEGMSNEEIADHLLGPVDDIKHLLVCHFVDVGLIFDRKGENTLKNIEVPLPQPVISAKSYSWPVVEEVQITENSKPHATTQAVPSENQPVLADKNKPRAEQIARDYFAALNSDSLKSSVDYYADRVDAYGTVQSKADAYKDDTAYAMEYPFREFVVNSVTSEIYGSPSTNTYTVTVTSQFRRGLTRLSAGPLFDLATRLDVHVNDSNAEIVSIKNLGNTVFVKYTLLVSDANLQNSKGRAFASILTNGEDPNNVLREVILQDRFNYYKFNKRVSEDEPADWFAYLGSSDKKKRDAKADFVRKVPIVVEPFPWELKPGDRMDVEITARQLHIVIH